MRSIIAGILYLLGQGPSEAALPEPTHIPMPVPPERRAYLPMAMSYDGPMDFGKLRELAEAKGVPKVIFERAVANFRELRNRRVTARGCFAAVDTTGIQGRTWILCFTPKLDVREIPTAIGSGTGPGCQSSALLTNRTGCPRWWSNREDSCLSPGGAFMTGAYVQRANVQRVFVPLMGRDESNASTLRRGIGVHVAMALDGTPLEGKVDPRDLSRGNLVWPLHPSDPVSDLSADRPGGTMAVYIYPSKEDVQRYGDKDNPPYWNPECREEVQTVGWIDENSTTAELKKLEQAYESELLIDMFKQDEMSPRPSTTTN